MTSNEIKRIITLDGPAGSGKSTVAAILAKRLGYLHADSGALYRSLTVACIDEIGAGQSVEDFGNRFSQIKVDPESFQFRVDYENGQQLHFLNEIELGQRIRSLEVTERIRFIADDLAFRNRVNQLLRDLSKKTSIIVDGRDIGTVVFPETEYKFYLDADVHTRALRRFSELQESGISNTTLESIEKQISLRDEQDRNRKIGALRIPEKAILIDTSNIDRDMVVSGILAHLQQQF